MRRYINTKHTTHVSEAIPVFDLTAVLGDGWQPLLIFHEIPGFSCLFPTFHVYLERETCQQAQASDDTHNDHVAQAVWSGMYLLLLLSSCSRSTYKTAAAAAAASTDWMKRREGERGGGRKQES